MNPSFRQLRDFFVSLRLTVALLALSGLLVFGATLDQVNLGIWAIQEKWFRSLFVLWTIPDTGIPVPVFPGGYLLGGLLLLNLLFAHVYRFRFAWKKSGILLTHLGLILLLVGELLTGLWQEEFKLPLKEGVARNYAESYRQNELAIIDGTDPKFDDVVAVPEALLAPGRDLQDPRLPFRLVVRSYHPNAALRLRAEGDPAAGATVGVGPRIQVSPEPPTYKQDERNWPSALVELVGPEGTLGVWLVSTQLESAQRFDYAGRQWRIALRPQRAYQPYALTLLEARHDLYAGTDIPKNFSSRVRLTTPDGHVDREVLIYMNNPLRYGGLTFYQYQMDSEHATSVLQVVRNPSWLLPYIACALATLGLVIQFGIHLFGFITRRKSPAPAAKPNHLPVPPPAAEPTHPLLRHLPLAVLAAGVAAVVVALLPVRNPGAYDVTGFSRLPVLVNGRVKPLDTVARTTLLVLQNRQRVGAPDRDLDLTPDEWLLDVLFDSARADTYPTFAIDNPELLGLLQLSDDKLAIHYAESGKRVLALFGFLPSRYRRFAYTDLAPHLDELQRQAKLVEPVEPAARTPFQQAVMRLQENLALYQRLKLSLVDPASPDFLGELITFQRALPAGIAAVRAKEAGQPHDEAALRQLLDAGQRYERMEQFGYLLAVPPDRDAPAGTGWHNAGGALLAGIPTGGINPHVLAYAGLAHTWRAHRPTEFNEIIRLYRLELERRFPAVLARCDAERRFNAAEPFYLSMTLYAVAFLLAIFSWLRWPGPLGRAAFGLVALAWLLSTAGIGTRMWLEARPPVTNLYSSALFVGWGAVALCLGLERAYRNAIGSVAAGVIGFATLLIAHHLALGGDTLEMMRAVLDSNFWLATHVVVVTAGYAATFLAGFLALIYVVRGVFTKSLDPATADSLARMVYGIVCFATLFSLTGTVLGGIWADQSWGRFWGWDPKENGALIIVIWNAVILHARWGGLVRTRGLMGLAIGGNIVTSWSWFGVNMLGVGLHSYGFMDAAFWWLLAFVASQLAFIALACLPLNRWRSFQAGAVES